MTPSQQQWAKFRGYLSMTIDLILLGTIFGITNNNETGAWACSKNMVIWLYVFGGYLGAQFLYDLFYTLHYGHSRRPSEVCRLLSDVKMQIVLYGFGVAWLIYGNWVVWESAYNCRYNYLNHNAEIVWRLLISIICIGYLFFFYNLLIWILWFFLISACICKKAKGNVPNFCLWLPYMRAITAQTYQVERDLTNCGICDTQYKEDDDCIALNCSRKHYFHVNCLNKYIPHSKTCPYCLNDVVLCC